MSAPPSRVPSPRLALVALLVGLSGSFHFGMQLTATNPSQHTFLQFVRQSLRQHWHLEIEQIALEALWSVVVALLFLGAIFGSLILRPMADRLGRLRALLVGNSLSVLFLSLNVLSHILNRFELFALARMGLGFSLAICLGLAGIFLAECSPKRCRGSVSMSTGVLLQLGTIFGSVLGIPSVLGSPAHWWVLFALEGAQLLLLNLLLALLARESPGFLLLRRNESAACLSVLLYHNCRAEELPSRMADLRRDSVQSAQQHSVGLCQLARQRGPNRKVGCVVALAMAFSGIAVVNAFAVELFRSTGLPETGASMANVVHSWTQTILIMCAPNNGDAFPALSVLSVAANLGSALLVDRFGRRRLLLGTLSLILAVNVAISGLMVAYDRTQLHWLGWCLIGAISLFSVAFAFGPGPVCYFLPAELVEQNARSAAQGWATLAQMASRALLLGTFLPLRRVIGGGFAYFSLFVLPILVSLLFLFYRLPETKNRDLSEVRRGMRQLPRSPLGKRKRQTAQNGPEIGWTSVVVNGEAAEGHCGGQSD